MEHLLTSFTTVAPLLLMMAVGLLLARTRLVPKDVFLIANRIVYYVGLPALIFRNLIRQDDASDADPAVILLVQSRRAINRDRVRRPETFEQAFHPVGGYTGVFVLLCGLLMAAGGVLLVGKTIREGMTFALAGEKET